MASKHIYLFLFDGFSDWEISYVTPELNKSDSMQLHTFSLEGQSVTSVGGLKVQPDLSLHQLNDKEISMLILPGGEAWESGELKEVNTLLQTLQTNQKAIAAICAATTRLAELGFLEEIHHTSNDLDYLKALVPTYRGEKRYQRTLAVTDGNIITANGIAPIEFARDIFKKLALWEDAKIESWYQLFKNGIWTE